jgi:GT2 family glycosyltransferase
VDNGSEPDVRAFLAQVKPQGAIQEVTLLQNEQNEGFPRGMNRGLRATRAPYTCFLNNDLIFTPGWLEEMLAVAAADPSIGLVNPSSSNFGVHPPRGSDMPTWARQRLQRLRGTVTEMGMCIGFCVLIKREILEKVGYLTEEIERIFFEDEDYSMRVVQAGYRCVTADAAYVYHAEHKSMKPSPEREALFNKNKSWCEQKYGKRLRIAWPCLELPPLGSAELKRWLGELIEWARRRTYIYVYCPLPSGLTARDVFKSVGLVPHVDILWFPISKSLAAWHAKGYILKRRKKPFSLIVAPNQRWLNTMQRLRWLHKAELVPVDNRSVLVAQWQQKSR